VWGWRLPFLLAIVTLVAAITLRYNMPESQEVRHTTPSKPCFPYTFRIQVKTNPLLHKCAVIPRTVPTYPASKGLCCAAQQFSTSHACMHLPRGSNAV
jgi:hypothetical protein